MVIYKYKLKVEIIQRIMMPANARILSIQVQGDEICLWAEVYVDRDNQLEEHTLIMRATGQPVAKGSEVYRATVQLNSYVWHIYEEPHL